MKEGVAARGRVIFVTGTDTGVGKTEISCALLVAARAKGLATLGLKPIAAGCEETDQGPRNGDAQRLRQAMTARLDYAQVNPFALRSAVAPHIAARQEGIRLSVAELNRYYHERPSRDVDFTLIEGAGGWMVPLNADESYADWVVSQALPVVMVVAMRLGCINHSLLTCEAILSRGLTMAGWVANQNFGVMPEFDSNLLFLKDKIEAPLLGVVPPLKYPGSEEIAKYLEINPLLQL